MHDPNQEVREVVQRRGIPGRTEGLEPPTQLSEDPA